MPILSENLLCEIQLAITTNGKDIVSPNSYQKDASSKICQVHRFHGSIRSSASYSSDITADPTKVLSLLLSKGLRVLGVRFLKPPESHAGLAYFRPCDIIKWRTGYSFPHSHLRIEVSCAEWESLDFYVDGVRKWPHLL